MEQTLYYAMLDDETFGPFSLETIYNMHLSPDILVLTSENNQWRPAQEYIELIDSLDLTSLDIEDNIVSSPPPYSPPRPQAPSFSNSSMFYIRRGGNPYGPYTLEALATVPLTDTTEVSVDGMMNWYMINEIAGLQEALCQLVEPDTTQPEAPQSSGNINNLEISGILADIKDLVPTGRQLFRRVFASKDVERDFLIKEYNRTFDTLTDLIRRLANACVDAQLGRKSKAIITSTVNSAANKINDHYLSKINQCAEEDQTDTTSSVHIGTTKFTLLPPLNEIEIVRIDFLSVLGNKNLCITYDDFSQPKALDFVNSIFGRLYQSNPARQIIVNVIDPDFMTGIDDAFKLMDRELYRVISRQEDVRATLSSMQQRASMILRNLLVERGSTLKDYNTTHENKEPYYLLVFKDFPHGLSTDGLENLRRLSQVGPKVGIFTIILTSDSNLENMAEKENEAFDLSQFAETANSFHFKQNDNDFLSALESNEPSDLIEGNVEFDMLSESDLRQIVRDVNSKCELKEDVIVSISDYIPATDKWWMSESARQIEIPFGVGNDMSIKSLRITQESGQNTAVVIGIPGSGKSVFLHSLICSAALKYSPDELRMYLIDFSGVEFNSYALGRLPHARVIAPEAEREFGLSILNELVEEGARRMSLCRDHNVSNIVDLKRVAPDVKVPRLLVIIDEFQKLFEVENDIIARESNSKIHTIIQEFRKFGINLILATQKLPSGTFLPRDLIANRIVFKSSPADFSNLISTEGNSGMPRLRTGQCVYNSESGAAYDNEQVQGFYVSKNDIDSLLAQINKFESSQSYEREQLKVFRSTVQPEFRDRRTNLAHVGMRSAGQSIPVYLGESISVSAHDVNFDLGHENGSNLLIIGGEQDVAENICFYSLLSVSTFHNVDDAQFTIINGMKMESPHNPPMMSTLEALPFGTNFPKTPEEIETSLNMIKEIIDDRRSLNEAELPNIFIGIFDMQNCRAFDKDTSGRYEKASAAATILEYIIKNGPGVGVFTIMQTDNLESLTRIGSVLSAFNHRVALQMTENDSQKLVGSSAANKLFVFNRPASKYRGYLRDTNRNIMIKFKPYKSI